MDIPGLKTIELNDHKAGMVGLNKEEINRIIYKVSKGTPYFKYQEKRQERINKKVQEMKLYLNSLTDFQKNKAKDKMDILAKKLEEECDLSHIIVHFDMDAFYAAVEIRDNPEFKDKPIAVGSNYMLSTSNYIARKFGVRAAMPGFIAKKLCHNLIIIPPNFEKYNKVSQDVFCVLKSYDPNFLPMSLDEAYVDITDYICNHYTLPLDEKFLEEWCWNDSENSVSIGEIIDKVVNEIRQKIFEKTQLTASAGIAPNMMLAKICSDKNKPNGQFRIPCNSKERKKFILELPIRKISGIGPVQEQMLTSLGIETCQDLWEKRDIIALLFTHTTVQFYLRVALGLGHTQLRCDNQRKSIGVEETFSSINDPTDLYQKCKELCEELAKDLTTRKIKGKTVILKIKTTNFDVHTRNKTLNTPTSDVNMIYASAKKLLQMEIMASYPNPLKLRLMGIRMCNIIDDDVHSQPTIINTLENCQKKNNQINSTLTVLCPICNQPQLKDNINHHLDQCLQEENEFSIKESFFQSTLEMKNCIRENIDNEKQLLKESNKNTEESINEYNGDISENLFDVVEFEDQTPDSSKLNIYENCISQNSEKFDDCISENLSDILEDQTPDSDKLNIHENSVSENSENFESTMTCPICGFYKGKDLQQLNQHLDLCLNKSTVRELVSQTIYESNEKRKKISPSQTSQSRKRLKSNDNSCRKIKEFFCSPGNTN